MRNGTYYNVKRVIGLAIMMTFILSLPVNAKENNNSDKSNGKSSVKMPAAMGNSSMTQGYEAAKKAIEESLREEKGPSLSGQVKELRERVEEKAEDLLKALTKEIDGKRYYADGRLAVERDPLRMNVYTYQESGDYTVYAADRKKGTYTVDQYRSDGKLISRSSLDGTYSTYFFSGDLLKQVVVANPTGVLTFEYNYDTSQDPPVLSSVYTYKNYSDGSLLYSTTHFQTLLDGSSLEITDFEAGGQEVKKDGLLMESTDTAGVKTTYRYTYDRKGRLAQQIATRLGRTTRVNLQAQFSTFRKIAKAVLKSVARPEGTFTVHTKDKNHYEIKNGVITQLRARSGETMYFSPTGQLLSVTDKKGNTLVRLDERRGEEYLFLLPLPVS